VSDIEVVFAIDRSGGGAVLSASSTSEFHSPSIVAFISIAALRLRTHTCECDQCAKARGAIDRALACLEGAVRLDHLPIHGARLDA
jgi:hypothetical protein